MQTFSNSIIGDPVLERGLSYIPANGNTRGSSPNSVANSGTGGDDVPPIRRPTSSIRGGVGVAVGGGSSGGGSRPSGGSSMGGGGSGSGGSSSGTGRPPFGREIAAGGRDPTIVTRDPTAFSSIDDILGKHTRFAS